MEHKIKISGDIVPFTSEWAGEYEFSLNSFDTLVKDIDFKENDELIIDINTFGGDVETGFAIYNKIKRIKAEKKITTTTRQDGYCASIGTVILLAGDKRIGNNLNSPFVHPAWTVAVGNSDDLQKTVDDLERTNIKIAKVYSENTKMTFEEARALMNEEAFIEPERCLELGFYTELENVSNNLIYNSIRNLKNKSNMSVNNQIQAIYNKLFGTKKNKIVYSADNTEVDFFELADNDSITVGAKATVGGATAEGEVLMSNNETYVFKAGVLIDIKEEVADDEIDALRTENENLKAEIKTLKTAQNSLKSENDLLVKFKNEVLNLKQEEPTPAKKENEKNKQPEHQDRKFNFYPEKNKK